MLFKKLVYGHRDYVFGVDEETVHVKNACSDGGEADGCQRQLQTLLRRPTQPPFERRNISRVR